jgi:hypothetical protein
MRTTVVSIVVLILSRIICAHDARRDLSQAPVDEFLRSLSCAGLTHAVKPKSALPKNLSHRLMKHRCSGKAAFQSHKPLTYMYTRIPVRPLQISHDIIVPSMDAQENPLPSP